MKQKLKKEYIKRPVFLLSCFIVCIAFMSGCGGKNKETEGSLPGKTDKTGISVVTTIFPPYDFVREITGGEAKIDMLLSPGMESHSYEPTPQDIIKISECDLFIYVGGESDAWIGDILESMDHKKPLTVTLMDCVEPVLEETIEGMDEGLMTGEDEHREYDEHVWTSPRNAQLIVEKLAKALCEADPSNEELYQSNRNRYAMELEELDRDYRTAVEHGKRRELVFGDRFPFRYLADAYGLSYHAAFPGCSSESEPSAATIAYLTDKVRLDEIPLVLYLELSNHKIADAIAEASGAGTAMLHSCHNISKDEIKHGVTYLSLMKQNLEVLKEALQ